MRKGKMNTGAGERGGRREEGGRDEGEKRLTN